MAPRPLAMAWHPYLPTPPPSHTPSPSPSLSLCLTHSLSLSLSSLKASRYLATDLTVIREHNTCSPEQGWRPWARRHSRRPLQPFAVRPAGPAQVRISDCSQSNLRTNLESRPSAQHVYVPHRRGRVNARVCSRPQEPPYRQHPGNLSVSRLSVSLSLCLSPPLSLPLPLCLSLSLSLCLSVSPSPPLSLPLPLSLSLCPSHGLRQHSGVEGGTRRRVLRGADLREGGRASLTLPPSPLPSLCLCLSASLCVSLSLCLSVSLCVSLCLSVSLSVSSPFPAPLFTTN